MSASIVMDAVETAKEKAEPVVRKAKKAAQNAAKKAEPMLEAAKIAGKQISSGYVPELYVQDSNRQFDCAELLERCVADFREKYAPMRISSCKLYIKPEDNMVYYVINDIEDKLPL